MLDIEVNASSGQVEKMFMTTRNVSRPQPNVEVKPPLLARGPHPERKLLPSEGRKTDPASPAYSATFLSAILPQISDFAAKLKLDLRLPLTTNDVDLPRYFCGILEDRPTAQLFLKNGDRFNYLHGHVAAFYAHDAYSKFPEEGRLEDFRGEIKITPSQATALCERAIRNLGYAARLPKAVLGSPTYVAYGSKDRFSRYIFYWWQQGQQLAMASFEVDATDGHITSVYFDDPSLWREPPDVVVQPR
jgi:hypothetical protein